jgi:HEAT repeat protein
LLFKKTEQLSIQFLGGLMSTIKIPQSLIEEIKRKNCVLFVGAGLARGAGLPDWESLLLKLIELGEEDHAIIFSNKPALIDLIKGKDKKYLTAADSIVDNLSPTVLALALTKIFRNENVIPNDTYKLLSTIPFASIITTNYDKLLESTYSSLMPDHPIIVNNNNRSALKSTLHRGAFYLLKAHGDIDEPETIILGTKSYRKLLHDNKPYTEHLETVFRTKTVLFVGFSMNDPDLELLLNKETVSTEEYGKIHYALMDETTLNPIKGEELFKTFGIKPILYNPSNPSHPEVKDFLIQLSQRTDVVAETTNSSTQSNRSGTDIPDVTEVIAEHSVAKGEVISGTSQINEMLDTLRKSSGEKEDVELDNSNAARLLLLAKTVLARYIPSSLLDNHEANNLYLYREKMLMQSSETIELLRTIINDEEGYIPGWYWLSYLSQDLVEPLIFRRAFFDLSNSVRENAFKMLALARIVSEESYEDNLSWSITKDPSPAVRRSCLSYLGRVGNQEHLSLVGSGLVDDDQNVSEEANLSRYLILSREKPNKTFKDLLSISNLNFDSVLSELKNKAQEIETDNLLSALEHSINEVRFFAVEELLIRNQLDKETAIKLKNDKYDPIKTKAYRFLVQKDRDRLEPSDISLIPEDYYKKYWSRNLHSFQESSINREEIVLSYYEKYSYEQLKLMVRWSDYFSSDIYFVLAFSHFDEFGEDLREDLQSDFKALAEEYYKDEVKRYQEWKKSESDFTPTIFGGWRKREKSTPEEDAARSVESEKEKYIKAALTGLLKNGSPADIEFGRRFLFHKNSDVSIEAVKIIQKWGNDDDISDLIKIAKSSDALLQELATQVALSVSNADLRVVEELLSTEDVIIVSITVGELISQADKEKIRNFLKNKRYLYHENAEVRMRILAFYIFQNESENLYALLKDYTSAETYYYDIVCYLDRILYAPVKLQLAYRQSLRDKFFDFLNFEDGFIKVVEENLNREKILDDLIEKKRRN